MNFGIRMRARLRLTLGSLAGIIIFSGVCHSAFAERRFENLCADLLSGNSTKHLESQLIGAHSEWVEVNLKLRTTYRSGPKRQGVPDSDGESILEHSVKVRDAALIYFRDAPAEVREHAALLALFHDIAEYKVPDFTPDDPISREDKHAMERAAVRDLVQTMGTDAAARIEELFVEYEEGKTPVAKMVKQLDKLDVVPQTLRYERMGYDLGQMHVFSYARKQITDPLLTHILEILAERKWPKIDPYDQYYTLLNVRGDRARFEAIMAERSAAIP